MDKEIMEEYLKVEDKISQEEFLSRMELMKKEYEDVSFMKEIDLARMISGEFVSEKNVKRSEKENHKMNKIDKLESGVKVPLIGRVMNIGSPKTFKTRKGKEGRVANMIVADETGEIKTVLWTESIPKIKNINEGDVIKISRVEIKDGYRSLEAQVAPRSSIEVLDPKEYDYLPEYSEEITNISDLRPEHEYNIIARIIRIPRIRTYESNGREGKVVSIELQDKTGKINYTLWNKDTDLIKELDLNEGDGIKVIGARCSERNDEISLSHSYIGRIVKDDFELPEYDEKISSIASAKEGDEDLVFIGILSKIQDTILFERNDGTQGSVKSLEIMDNTDSIKVTLWGDDTEIDINKGDILKLSRPKVEFDEYASSGLRLNTNWNTGIEINPENIDEDTLSKLEECKSQLGPKKINTIQEMIEDGEEVDVIGRIFRINEIREFNREDGTTGLVRSVEIADDSGNIRLSLWDEKAELPLELGQAVSVENARTKLGLYSVDLNLNRTSRIIPYNGDLENLPSLEEIEDALYDNKKIEDIGEDDRNIRVLGRILELNEPSTFQRQDGQMGLVRSMEIADETGVIRCSLWDDQAEKHLTVGSAIKIENPSVSDRNDRVELNIGRTTSLKPATDGELSDIPIYEELLELAYKSKKIEELEEGDINISVNGQLTDVRGDRLLLSKCPNCNERFDLVDGEDNFCEFCGEQVDEPKYILMIPARIYDETGDVIVTFFGQLAEKILGRTTEGVVDTLNKSTDDDVFVNEVEDLNGVHLTVIADVDFDDYNEEIRLRPKKVLE